MKVYVLIYGGYSYDFEVDIEGVTSDKEIAEKWKNSDKDYDYDEVELIENIKQYEEWLKE